ncbi:MAG: biotin--[Clostridia bacterium]|nr:biotin--[acetyl-CoA-carboxylase] ligase [Clostridia bacterium]
MKKELLLDELARYADDSVSVVFKDTTVSTNADARELIGSEMSGPVLIIASEQTGGRGRQGKSFLSPEGGLYMSLVFRSDVPIESVIPMTSAAAVGVCRAIADVAGAQCGIKWVNDIYYDGKKLAGILVESINNYEAMTSDYLIIGIGINMTTAPDVETIGGVTAASLSDEGYDVEVETLCAKIVGELLDFRNSGYYFPAYIDDYRRLSVVLGREITFTQDGVTCSGTAQSIGENGELIVSCGDETVALASGEISVRVLSGDSTILNYEELKAKVSAGAELDFTYDGRRFCISCPRGKTWSIAEYGTTGFCQNFDTAEELFLDTRISGMPLDEIWENVSEVTVL